MNVPKVLIVGLGNTTRSDDGAAWEVVCLLELMRFPGLETRVTQQLGLELMEEWRGFDQVLLVDAALGDKAVRIEKVSGGDSLSSPSTHHLKPEILLQLSRWLYHGNPELYLCRVPAVDFGFGESLSSDARRHVREALRQIKAWLIENRYVLPPNPDFAEGGGKGKTSFPRLFTDSKEKKDKSGPSR